MPFQHERQEQQQQRQKHSHGSNSAGFAVSSNSTPSNHGDNNNKNNKAFLMKLSLIASMSGLLFGYDTGVVSGAVIFIRPQMELSALAVEIAVASTILAAAISAWYGHYFLETYGRKGSLVIASMAFIVGSLVMAFAWGPGDFIILVIGRIAVGLAIGLASEAGPLYISECAPPESRGSLTTLFNVAVVGGQVSASIICGLFSYLPAWYNWRLMLLFGAVPALAQMIGFSMLPLSPAWLVFHGRNDEAKQVLYQIRGVQQQHEHDEEQQQQQGANTTTTTTTALGAVQKEYQDIVDEHEIAKTHEHVTLAQLWTQPQHSVIRRAMVLGCSLWAISQLAGINTIMYYGASIVRSTGIEGGRSFDIWITVPLMSMQLVGILYCYKIIDAWGRRKTLLTSMAMVCIGLVLIGLGFMFDSGYLTVFAMCVYLFSFGLGLSTMPYTMNSEIYPTEYRGVCISQSTAVFWLVNFLVSLTFLTLARLLGHDNTFFLYAIIVALSSFYFYYEMPETTGLSLHEIQELFSQDESMLVASVRSLGEDGKAANSMWKNYGSIPNNETANTSDEDDSETESAGSRPEERGLIVV